MDCAGGSTLEEPPKSPRSPPACVDLYGKRRQTVKVQVLEREIGLLQVSFFLFLFFSFLFILMVLIFSLLVGHNV